MHNKSGFSRFTGRGCHVDEAFRKVWASFMELLDNKLQKDNAAKDGLLLTNGSDPMRAVFPRLSATADAGCARVRGLPATQPPADDGSVLESSDDNEDDESNEDDEEDADGMHD